MINLQSILNPAPSVASRIMDREAVLVHPQKGEVKVLNELGAEVWKRLDGDRTVHEIVDELIQVYAVARDQLERDVVVFLDSLHERGLVDLLDPDKAS